MKYTRPYFGEKLQGIAMPLPFTPKKFSLCFRIWKKSNPPLEWTIDQLFGQVNPLGENFVSHNIVRRKVQRSCLKE